MELVGSLDLDTFEGALNGLLDRHEVFRCAFAQDRDRVELFVDPSATVSVTVVQVSFVRNDGKFYILSFD